jgi:hypothetical protein
VFDRVAGPQVVAHGGVGAVAPWGGRTRGLRSSRLFASHPGPT